MSSKQASSYEINSSSTTSDITSKFRLKKSRMAANSNTQSQQKQQQKLAAEPAPTQQTSQHEIINSKNYSAERRHAISSLDVSAQKKKGNDGAKRGVDEVNGAAKKSSSSSSSADRIDDETNNYYEQCSISSSVSSVTSESGNNFPTIQINEAQYEYDLESAPPPPNDHLAHKFRTPQARKELDDPFLRDLTACLQMKQKKV